MDYSGRGYVTKEDLLGSMLVHKMQCTKDDLGWLLDKEKYFYQSGKMEYDQFKKAFFPHLFPGDINEEYGEAKDQLKIKVTESE